MLPRGHHERGVISRGFTVAGMYRDNDSMSLLQPADATALRHQMGRNPRGVVAIAARCPAGHPSVFTTYPLLRRGTQLLPFPTLYWLSCPRLRTQVAHLEREGAIAALGKELSRDPVLREALRHDHESYIAQRWNTLRDEDQRLVSERGLLDYFRSHGIGGMKNHATVKCLHLHLAHHLVSGSALGERIVRRYGVTRCGEGPPVAGAPLSRVSP